MKYKTLLILFLLAFSITIFGQNIDSKWDSFYNNNPSGIEFNYRGTDFIKVIDIVSFVPQSSMLKKDIQLLEKALLTLDEASLKQMSITGNYYSRTIKHDDYFELYNLYYNKITKSTWDKYCPYLLPLMDIDQVVNLR